jgi:hypothetical protein
MVPVIMAIGFFSIPILMIIFSGVIEIITVLKNTKKDDKDE